MAQESVVKSKRIAAPEFWRFFFFMFVCFLHFEEDVYDDVLIVAKGGHLVADFFFLLSGFAVAYSYQRKPIVGPTLQYVYGKVKKIYPDFLFSVLLMFILFVVYDSSGIKSVLLHLYECRFQYFFVNALFPTGLEMRSIWFLSYWVVGLIVLSYILKRKAILVWGGVALSFMSWHWCYIGTFYNNSVEPEFVWSVRLTKCVAEVLIGAWTYELMKGFENVRFSPLGRFMLSVFEFMVIAYVIFYMTHDCRNHVDYYICLGFVLIIMFSFWNKTYLSKMLDNKVSIFLGKLSFPIFLYHLFVVRLFAIYLHNNSHKLIIYIGVALGILLSSYLFHLFVEKYFNKFLSFVCNALIIKE